MPRGSRTTTPGTTTRGGRTTVPPPYYDTPPYDPTRTRAPGDVRGGSTYTPDDDPRRPDPDGGRSYPGPGAGPEEWQDDVNRQPPGREPGGNGGREDTESFGALDWLIAQQQRRNPYMEALRMARSGGYAADLQKWASMRGASGGQLGAIGAVLARDASARTTSAALQAAPQYQSQRDSALAQLIGTKMNAMLTREQLDQQYRMFQEQLADNQDARADASRDSRRNQWMSLIGGVAGLGLSALLPGPWSATTALAGFGVGSNAFNRTGYQPPATPQAPALQALTQPVGTQYGTMDNIAPASAAPPRPSALDALTQQPGMAYGAYQGNNPYSFLSQYQPYSATVSGWDQIRR